MASGGLGRVSASQCKKKLPGENSLLGQKRRRLLRVETRKGAYYANRYSPVRQCPVLGTAKMAKITTYKDFFLETCLANHLSS